MATRKAYGEALAALGSARGDVVALDGEVSNSTFAEIFRDAHPDRYFEMYIAEQQMAAAAVGLQARGWRVFASSFAAFHSRAYDFIRMAAISRATLCLSGSHAGISIGEDGPSQMALEDVAMMRAVHGSTVLHPSDGNQTVRLVAQMADLDGISYLRTLRPDTPVLYGPDEDFPIGGSRVLRSSDDDEVTLVGCGITVHEALKAADALAEEGIRARVVDCYSIKPIDGDALASAAEETGRLVVAEDHWPEGGLGDAVLGALADRDAHAQVRRLAVREMPRSGKSAELLAAYGIDAAAIAEAARELVRAGACPQPRASATLHGGAGDALGPRDELIACVTDRRRPSRSRVERWHQLLLHSPETVRTLVAGQDPRELLGPAVPVRPFVCARPAAARPASRSRQRGGPKTASDRWQQLEPLRTPTRADGIPGRLRAPSHPVLPRAPAAQPARSHLAGRLARVHAFAPRSPRMFQMIGRSRPPQASVVRASRNVPSPERAQAITRPAVPLSPSLPDRSSTQPEDDCSHNHQQAGSATCSSEPHGRPRRGGCSFVIAAVRSGVWPCAGRHSLIRTSAL